MRLKKIIKLLGKYDINITVDEVLEEADGVVARPHIAAAIIKKYPERGYTKDDLFRDYLGNYGPCYVEINNYEAKDGMTGGSDFHGPHVRNTMGKVYLEGDYVEKFLNRINFRK